MELSKLTKITKRSSKRLGQGHGSGRGKTGGRGTKGQNAKGKRPLSFEGGAVPLIKRLPFMRGKGKNKSFRKKPVIVNLKVLNLFFKKGDSVDLESLIKKKIVDGKDARILGVKILGDGEISTPLTIKLPISKSAAKKIEKSGGKIEKA